MTKKHTLAPPTNHPPKGQVSSLRALRRYLAPHKLALMGMTIALLITSSTVLSFGKALEYLVDQGFGKGNPELLDDALIALFAIVILLAAATFARYTLITYVGEKVIAALRKDVYRHLIYLDQSFYEHTKLGELLSRITTDTSVIQMVVGSSLSVALRNSIMLVGGIILLLITSPKLTLIISIIVPLVILPIILIGKKVRYFSRLAQDKVATLSAHTDESLRGLMMVQAYVQEAREITQFNQDVEAAFSTAMKRVQLRGILTAIVILLVFSGVGIVLWVGGHDVLNGTITPGNLSSFVFYAVIVAGSVGALSEVVGSLQQAAGATERLMELLQQPHHIISPPQPKPLPSPFQKLAFNDVSFSYPTHPNIQRISTLSFTITQGEHIAIVGPSGAGKSTLFALLLRLYDPVSGHIAINETPIKQLKLADLRHLFAIVSQDPMIFSTSALENIRYGKPEATDKEVIEAARAAYAYDFIMQLPDGMNTHLGERGVTLSGGEKQRIAIARAFLKNPEILLLDEATSALDSESETYVQEALSSLVTNRTTLIIAHRLSTIKDCDRIIVLEHGTLAEMGTHDKLLKAKGLYHHLVSLQFEV